MAIKQDNPPIPKTKSWEMFDRISPRYDFLNHFLSFGCDIGWRRRLRQFLPEQPNLTILDLATGTADVLITLTRNNPRIEKAFGLDLAENMLQQGREKVSRSALDDKIVLQNGDANQVPFADSHFDVATIAFGIRNVENPIIALKEMYRVLKAQGRVLILEFSLPQNFLLRALHLLYLKIVVPTIGGLVSGNFSAYWYLNKTIGQFPYGIQFCRMMKQVGFKNPQAHPLLGGIATIYAADK